MNMKAVTVWLFLLSASLSAAMGIETGCPYDFTVASQMIPSACYVNSTDSMVRRQTCCWSAYASFVFAVVRYANQTGIVFLDSDGAKLCIAQFVDYVRSGGLVQSNYFTDSKSGCAIDAGMFTANAGPCKFATINEIWATVDLRNASEECYGPNLNRSDACSKCQGAIEARSLELLNVTKSKDFVPCGMAVTFGVWGRNPFEGPFDMFVSCVTQVLQDIGNLGTADLIPSPPAVNNVTDNHSGWSKGRRVRVGMTVGVAVVGVIVVVAVAWVIAVKVKEIRHLAESTMGSSLQTLTRSLTGRERSPPPPPQLPTDGLYIFTRRELLTATDGFDTRRVLGQGGSGKVYLGTLPSGKTVAIKRVTKAHKVAQFYQEVELLSRLRHPNLTALLGYCRQKRDHVLVYEYMAGGDLGNVLYHPQPGHATPWSRRLQIALDCAQGLKYLHLFPEGAIVHRDIKPNNILLNESGQAKLGDFGVSKLVAPDFTHASTEIKGTTGYLDPEYFSVGQLTEASDVYSFGVVLLELVTGQRAVITTASGGAESIVYATHVFMAEKNTDMRRFVDPRIADDVDESDVESIRMVVELACACVRPYRIERPSIVEVLGVLTEALTKSTVKCESITL